jgi:hypothetical protein
MSFSSRSFRGGAAALLVALTVGCAGGAGPGAEPASPGPAAPEGASVVTVQNNSTLGTDMTIFLEPEGRAERVRVGNVAPGQTLQFVVDLPTGFARLVGEHNLGDVRSDRFNITGPSTVRWIMRTTRIELGRR